MLTKKDLQERYQLSDETVYKTLKACGLGTKKTQYTEEEVEKYFEPARKLVNDGKTYKEVEEYFNTLPHPQREERGDKEVEVSVPDDVVSVIGDEIYDTVEEMVHVGVQKAIPYIPQMFLEGLRQEAGKGAIKKAFAPFRKQFREEMANSLQFESEAIDVPVKGLVEGSPEEESSSSKS